MADTGFRSFSATSGDWYISGANAIDDNDSPQSQIFNFSGGIETAYVSELEGDDIPTGATINGVEIQTITKYGTNPSGGITFTVQVSSNGVSGTYDTSETSETLGSGYSTETFGSSTELWGVNFGTWTDITNLAVKMIFTPGTTALYVADVAEVRAKIYYTPMEPKPHPRLSVKGGNFKILSGKLTIK